MLKGWNDITCMSILHYCKIDNFLVWFFIATHLKSFGIPRPWRVPHFTFYDYRKKLWSFKHAIRSVKLIRKRFDLVENSGPHWILWRPKQLREAIYIQYNWWAKIFPPLSFLPFEPHFDSAQFSQKRYGTRSILNVEVLL